MSWRIGVDTGGTFTDIFAHDPESGAIRRHKRPSTPEDPSRAVLLGVAELGEKIGADLAGATRIGHGTTVGTNALIQRRGGRIALITTKGFRDLLEIGRQIRPHMFDLQRDAEPPVVPRERRFEIVERVGPDGAVLRPLAASELERVVEEVRDSGAEAVAVCLLFGFLNPSHEQAAGEALARALPDLDVSLSSAVRPEFREYERFTTTALNAYLQPVMARYLGAVDAGLRALAPAARIGVNQSNGGLMTAEAARRFPIRTALSGPAAGVVGAQSVGRASGRRDLITIDVGGTSADMALIRGGEADMSFERAVADFPIRLPMIDIHTIGAGGGSIAWFDRDGLLKVGPESAGAVPGPACYGRGGDRPTVSDANLVLGRLGDELVGGDMRLDRQAAEQAMATIAEPLGLGVERAALGVVDIVTANMVRAIRAISIERGYDPRRFALMPFGGAGPLHARGVAAELGMAEIIVPRSPGVLCAEGLLAADQKEDFTAPCRLRIEAGGEAALAEAATALSARAETWFAEEGIAPARRRVALALDARYVGQNFELPTPLVDAAPGAAAPPPLDEIRARFFAAHRQAYGHADESQPVEAITLRLTALGAAEPFAERAPEAGAAPEPAAGRPVWFDSDHPVETPVYRRETLPMGARIEGPAIIEQLDAVTPIHPGDVATVDAAGALLIEIAS